MALRLVNLHRQETFVWSQDPGKGTDEETKFFHRPLDSYEQAYLQDRLSTIERLPTAAQGESAESIMSRVKTQTEVHKVAIEAVRIACTGFENLEDENGNPVEYATEQANIGGKAKHVLKQDILRRLPVNLCMEFYMQVMSDAKVQPSAEKNSAPASSPSNSSESETVAPAQQPKRSSGGTQKTQ